MVYLSDRPPASEASPGFVAEGGRLGGVRKLKRRAAQARSAPMGLVVGTARTDGIFPRDTRRLWGLFPLPAGREIRPIRKRGASGSPRASGRERTCGGPARQSRLAARPERQ
jgi:hypothetical protein